MKAIKAVPIPPSTNNIVEAQTFLFGLVLAKKRWFNNIYIEGDSMIIINARIKKSLLN